MSVTGGKNPRGGSDSEATVGPSSPSGDVWLLGQRMKAALAERDEARSQVVELGQKVEQLERVGICGSRTQGLTLPNAASSDLVCTLLADHRGWHQDDAGAKWSVRPESVDLPGDWKTQIWDTLMLGNGNPGECQGDLVQLIESWRPKAADDQPVAARVWQKGDPEPVPPGPYAKGGRSPIVWVLLCPTCAGYAPMTADDYQGFLSGQCAGCGAHARELHRFRAWIDSAAGCNCTGIHQRVVGEVTSGLANGAGEDRG